MSSPDNSTENLWKSKIIPGVERFVATPLPEAAIEFIRKQMQRHVLGYGIAQIVIREAYALAEQAEKVTHSDSIGEIIGMWFPYSAVAVHIGNQLMEGLDKEQINQTYSRLKAGPNRPSVAAVRMLLYRDHPQNFFTFMAIEPSGIPLVTDIVTRVLEAPRLHNFAFADPDSPNPDTVNRLISLGAERFTKYVNNYFGLDR